MTQASTATAAEAEITTATSSSTTTTTNVNLMANSSTPIRIGSFHGSSSSHGGSNIAIAGNQHHQHHHSHQGTATTAGNDSPSSSGQAQSSSVPTSGQHLPGQSSLASIPIQPGGTMSVSGAGGGGGVISSSITPPNSAGLRQAASAGGITNWSTDNREKYDGNQTDKTPGSGDTSKLNRKESYKAQRKNYRREKKRVASELLNALQDPAVIVLADWLKVRGTLKSWTKLWCVLKPGLLLIYKSPKTKSSHWVGTVMLNSCQVIERPSKKDGFCFKLFHPLEQSIWAPRGPDKETIGAVIQPLPTSYLIFRAPSQAAGKCWMDALELSLRCSALLLRSNSNCGAIQDTSLTDSAQISHETQWSEADYEKHFNEHDLDADSQNEGPAAVASGGETESDSDAGGNNLNDEDTAETPYIPVVEGEFGESGEQVEELADENKSLIWCLVKQVRPGMDLSKVVLPTFILEPRSFLDKLSDSYYHADILSRAVREDDPFTRMKTVVQWYLSGFYKKPKGLKKPYNPILGETFRCFWEHPDGSRTFYIAEQVSHHPPVSAFYVTNRQDGFCISCSILAKSKFYGNSTSAVLDGVATLTLLPRGESYTLNTPYAHCKGILMGTLSMELGGKINIDCENTGYKTELEFKLKPFLGGNDNTNAISGKIKLGKETLATISGHWDREMYIKDVKSNEESVLFTVSKDTKKQRLTRYLVPLEAQLPSESERLWQKVSIAIRNDDQIAATEEKTVLEEEQRRGARERKATMSEWSPYHFQQDPVSGEWIYKYADLRPWDPRNDLRQFECDYKVLTKTKHQAPLVRTSSMVSTDLMKCKRRSKMTCDLSDETSQSNDNGGAIMKKPASSTSLKKLATAIEHMNKALDDHSKQLTMINNKLERLQYSPHINISQYSNMNAVGQSRISFASVNQWMQRLTHEPSMIIATILYCTAGLMFLVFFRWLLK